MLQRAAIGSSDPRSVGAGTYALSGDPRWQDVRLVTHVQSYRDGVIGIVFRYQNRDNFYRVTLDRPRGRRRLECCQDARWDVLGELGASYELGDEYEIVVDAVGNRLRVWIGGAPAFDVLDSSHAHGGIGLFCRDNDLSVFHDVAVSRPPPARTASSPMPSPLALWPAGPSINSLPDRPTATGASWTACSGSRPRSGRRARPTSARGERRAPSRGAISSCTSASAASAALAPWA